MIDTIIIGAGPTGISAALYLFKLNHNVMVFGRDHSQLTESDIIDNYYGFKPISGPDLIKEGIEHARNLGIKVHLCTVIDVDPIEGGYEVRTAHGIFQSKTLVVATGKPRLPLKVQGFNTFRSRGIHMCATCDGFFYKQKRVALVGAGPYMEQELKVLENFTNQITIFSHGDPITHDTYPVINDPILSFTGEKKVKFVNTKNNSYEIDGIFIAIGFPSANELALKLGIVQEKSNIIVDEQMMTNLPGVFAGGDCIGGKLQIPKAIYDGLLISDGIHHYLRGLK